MAKVAELPCVICKHKLGVTTYGVQVHHVGPIEARNAFLTVPLCPEHHQGSTGVHGMHRRAFERFWKVDDWQMIAWTLEMMERK
jgi:hypothetical protein